MNVLASNQRSARALIEELHGYVTAVSDPLGYNNALQAVEAALDRDACETSAVTRDTPKVREIFERHDRCSKLLWGPASLPGMMLGPEDADAAHRDRGTLLSLIPGPPLHPKTPSAQPASASTGDGASPSRTSSPPVECPKCRTQLAFEGDVCGLCNPEVQP